MRPEPGSKIYFRLILIALWPKYISTFFQKVRNFSVTFLRSEFYFVHNWDSARGVYDINISSKGKSIDSITYELIQDPSYKLDKKVKDEYWNENKKKTELINTVINAWKYYEGNKTEVNYWMKNIFHWYYTNSITEEEVINSIEYLMKNEILKYD